MIRELTLQHVRAQDTSEAATFMGLGRPYMMEIAPEDAPIHERFLQSTLRRQGEPELWLVLFRVAGQPAGFAHFKIDRDERPG